MRKIAIISSSVREERLSHRVALFLEKYVAAHTGAQTEVFDLKEYDFPIFHERYMNIKQPSEALTDYVERFKAADGIIIVSPVYNASFPAALKNVIDILVAQWRHKPVAVVTVTYGATPGIATAQQLQSLMLKLGARVAAPFYTVLNAGTDFTADGMPVNSELAAKYAAPLVDELMWIIERSKE